MADITDIENQKLRTLIQESKHFNALSPEKRNFYITKFASFTKKKQGKVCSFFEEQNRKEKEKIIDFEREKIELLNNFYQEMKELHQKYKKLEKQDSEKVSRGEEEKEMSELLEQLEDQNQEESK